MLAAPLICGAFTEDTPRGLPIPPEGFSLVLDEATGRYAVDDDGAFAIVEDA